MPNKLQSIQQSDFSAGMVRSVARHLIPQNGAYDIVNGLLDDGGSVYRRAGSTYYSTGVIDPLRWVWSGRVGGQNRVLAGHAGGSFVYVSGGLVDLGTSGSTNYGKPVEIGGLLFSGDGVVYGGSQKSANYTTGTVSVTNGSKTVTGAGGTLWSANADAGMLLRVASTGRLYPVYSVDSNTQITLKDAYEGTTAAGQAYELKRTHTYAITGSAFPTTTAAPYRSAYIYSTVADRLVTGEGNRVFFSNARSATGVLRPHVFTDTDYHELPRGAEITGLAALKDTLFVFTTVGVWSISNMALDLTDDFGNPQHRVERVADLVLWHRSGIAEWRGALVVPARDGLYLFDGVSAPRLLSGAIEPLYTTYSQNPTFGFYEVGNAVVSADHYFLPVITNGAVSQGVFVCRLESGAWSRLTGAGGALASFAIVQDTDAVPFMVGVNRTSERILNLDYFNPSTARKSDHDGTAHTFEVTTRDLATGRSPMVENTVRRLRLWHETVDAGTDNPTISAYYSKGASETALSGSAPEDDGTTPYAWSFAARTERIRFRLTSASAAASMVLRALEILVRPSGRT